jgi:hypothetical protein
LQKTFELVIQQMQAPKCIMETTLGSQPLMQESFGTLKIGTNFVDNGTIIEKQDMFQEID